MISNWHRLLPLLAETAVHFRPMDSHPVPQAQLQSKICVAVRFCQRVNICLAIASCTVLKPVSSTLDMGSGNQTVTGEDLSLCRTGLYSQSPHPANREVLNSQPCRKGREDRELTIFLGLCGRPKNRNFNLTPDDTSITVSGPKAEWKQAWC